MNLRYILMFAILLISHFSTLAHESHSNNTQSKTWHINGSEVNGSFLLFRNGEVYIETEDHRMLTASLSNFPESEQKLIFSRLHQINNLNHNPGNPIEGTVFFLGVFAVVFFTLIVVNRLYRRKPWLTSSYAVLIFLGFVFASFTDPESIKKAFLPFSDYVRTFWDNEYFYVESNGIPSTHTMMVGVSDHGWQQQVPIPQCYIGSNAWKIPLNPTIADNPIPVDQIHFTRGAIAIAVNGVPIFNPHTNTGVDAFLDGQLDSYGGHSGRADDYHYHTAPLHLSSDATATLPIAYALDGFAVFGKFEPDGTSMQALDQNHGHLYNGLYHYHGTTEAPYMIGNMVGKVTEDATHQLVPQPSARPVRTEDWTPLKGALITACAPISSGNGYRLNYSLNGTQGYSIDYSWTGITYTFSYVTPTGTTRKTYSGFIQCPISDQQVTGIEEFPERVIFFPNPFTDKIEFRNLSEKDFFRLTDASGRTVFSGLNFKSADLSNLKSGMYYLYLNNQREAYRMIKN